MTDEVSSTCHTISRGRLVPLNSVSLQDCVISLYRRLCDVIHCAYTLWTIFTQCCICTYVTHIKRGQPSSLSYQLKKKRVYIKFWTYIDGLVQDLLLATLSVSLLVTGAATNSKFQQFCKSSTNFYLSSTTCVRESWHVTVGLGHLQWRPTGSRMMDSNPRCLA